MLCNIAFRKMKQPLRFNDCIDSHNDRFAYFFDLVI